MLGKKIKSIKTLAKLKNLAKTVNVKAGIEGESPSKYKSLRAMKDEEDSTPRIPTGFFPVYVGEERQRFVVPTGYLSHPLFRILLEKASEQFGFEPDGALVVPCSVNAFEEVVNAVQNSNGNFQFGDFVDEFV